MDKWVERIWLSTITFNLYINDISLISECWLIRSSRPVHYSKCLSNDKIAHVLLMAQYIIYDSREVAGFTTRVI